ncbi:MAG: hypothetical protein RSC81_07965 [Myroides sp.]
MKNYLLGLCSFFSIAVWAQNVSCEEKAKTMLIEKIKNYPSNQLIPYYSEKDDQWGYFDRKSKRKITEPVLREADFFHSHINLYYSLETNGQENGCTGKIMGSKEGYRLENFYESDYQIYETMMPAESMAKKTFKDKVNSAVNGFEVDENRNLTAFNPKFYNEEKDQPNIYDIFQFKGEHYAVVSFKNNTEAFCSVINQKGETFPGFEKLKNYPHRKQTYSHETDLWFLIETGENQFIFKSLFTGKQFADTFDNIDNWENFAQTIGYAIMRTNNKKGVLDLTTMKWKVKPAASNNFWYLNYSSLEPLAINYDKDEYSYNPTIIVPTEMIKNNRKNTYIYIHNSKNSFYDLNMKLYEPKD